MTEEYEYLDWHEDDGEEGFVPYGWNSVPERWFAENGVVRKVTLECTVTTICKEAFLECNNLTTLLIPDSVTHIEERAFAGCKKLAHIYYGGSREQWGSIRIEKGNRKLWDVTVHLKSGETFTLGESEIFWFDRETGILQSYNGRDTKVDIPAEIDGVPVRAIDDYAFSDCDGLTEVTVPDGVVSIGEGVFMRCYDLNKVKLPDSVTSLGSFAFRDCVILTDVNIPAGVKVIKNNTFEDCFWLEKIVIPEGVTAIQNNAFHWCLRLKEAEVPASVTFIGDDAFGRCKKLTSVTIPEGVTSIGEAAFCECYGLKEVRLPKGIVEIGEYAFSDCGKQMDVYYSGTQEQWQTLATKELFDTKNAPSIHFGNV